MAEIPGKYEIFDAAIIDETVYVISQYGLTKYDIYIDIDLMVGQRQQFLRIQGTVTETVPKYPGLEKLKKDFIKDSIYVFECSGRNGCGYLTARHHKNCAICGIPNIYFDESLKVTQEADHRFLEKLRSYYQNEPQGVQGQQKTIVYE